MRALLAFALLLLLALPAAASAGDASLEHKWDGYVKKTKRLGLAHASLSGSADRLARALRRLERVVARTRRAIAKDEGRTAAGRAARKAALAALKAVPPVLRRFQRLLPEYAEAFRLLLDDRPDKALAVLRSIRKPLRRVRRAGRRVARLQRRSTRLFERVR